MKLYGDILLSSVDGPGDRAVIHTAGCTIGCPGCFSPHTHSSVDAINCTIADVVERTLKVSNHVTISGGEPTEQMDDLIALCGALKSHGVDSIILNSGRTISWLKRHESTAWWQLVDEKLIDVLIAGPYVESRQDHFMLRGSTNKEFLLISDKYSLSDFCSHDVQFTVGGDGSITMLGFPTNDMLKAMEV